jgi:hypothetical protein
VRVTVVRGAGIARFVKVPGRWESTIKPVSFAAAAAVATLVAHLEPVSLAAAPERWLTENLSAEVAKLG